jgi:pyruvate formate lyase activating enzyme
MIIGGLEKLSILDYPDHLAAIIFTQGCNFRCHFCYNPKLVLPRKGEDEKNIKEKGFSPLSTEDLFLFLRERYGRLDGIVITGGEPTLHPDLPSFIKEIKEIGYDVKLDTNGTNPEMLQALIEKKLIDYVAMDLKAPFDKYEDTVSAKVICNDLKKSVKMIIKSGLPHEFRTTVVPGLLDKEDFKIMGESLQGADNWYLQKFKSDTDLVDGGYRGKDAYSDREMKEFATIGREAAGICEVRA